MAKRICIDAGHGGKDPGATNGNYQEKRAALGIALELGLLLFRGGYEVYFTRTNDTYVSLADRCKISNDAKADAFISLHLNSVSSGAASGVEVWRYAKCGALTKELATAIQDNVIEATGAGLLFYGKPGTGKTHLAVGIALEFIENNLSVIYTRAGAIVREVKESWGRKATQTESQIYEKYARPDLLIIDEIGRQFGTDTERMILFEVINARYEQRKPVLAVTNLDGANLAECLGAATLDRLRECGTSVCFDWESMRPKL